MSHAHAPTADHGHDVSHEAHPDSYYIKIWAILLVLLIISVLGPMLENPIITLLTAFGIAFIKGWIVCAYFMHLNVEKKYIISLLLISVFLMLVMFAGISPDVLKAQGTNWKWQKMNIVPVPIGHHGTDHNNPTANPAATPHH